MKNKEQQEMAVSILTVENVVGELFKAATTGRAGCFAFPLWDMPRGNVFPTRRACPSWRTLAVNVIAGSPLSSQVIGIKAEKLWESRPHTKDGLDLRGERFTMPFWEGREYESGWMTCTMVRLREWTFLTQLYGMHCSRIRGEWSR